MFNRLVKWSMFWFVTVIFALISVLEVLQKKHMNQDFANLIFDFTNFLPIAVIAAAGIFISKDYANNTIRNKIIVGHKRSSIYIANWILSACISIIFFLALTATAAVLGLTMLRTQQVSYNALLVNWLIGLLVMLVHSSIVTFICMLGKGSSSVLLAILVHFLTLIMVTIAQLFEMFNNNKVSKFLLEFFPTNVIFKLNTYEIIDNAALAAIYLTVIIAAVTLLGVYIFNRTDIK